MDSGRTLDTTADTPVDTTLDTTVVILGAGLAGTTLAHRLHAAGIDFRLVDPQVGDTVELPPLSKSLFTPELTTTGYPRTWDASHEIAGTAVEVHAEEHTVTLSVEVAPADEADRAARTFDMGGGFTAYAPLHRQVIVGYRTLVVATGMHARTYPEPLPGGTVHELRSRGDAEIVRTRLTALSADWPDEDPHLDIGVLGSGFLALELARGAADAGHHPTVYLRGDRPLPGLTPTTGRALMDLHAAAGVAFVENADPSDYGSHALWLAAVGAAANAESLPSGWSRRANGTIEVDAHLRPVAAPEASRTPGVHVIGDAATIVEGPMAAFGRLESEPMAMSQAEWLGEYLVAGSGSGEAETDRRATAPWTTTPWHWSFQGAVRVFTVGDSAASVARRQGTVVEDLDTLVLGDVEAGTFQVLLFDAPEEGSRDGSHDGGEAVAGGEARVSGEARLVGVETVGLPAAHNAARKVFDGGLRPTRAEAATEGFTFKSHYRSLSGASRTP
ncbi:FAD-dependent oxidoreductase [Brevibacterium litoralis]|uniref:FAD-dependent oxidoreductase n=1 Tax=Brevibacterium litoralis TaxID=3138935 RepID=UPI0032EAD13E